MHESTKQSNKVPVTILTGQLGAGKSTLLRYVLEKGSQKVAVIMNEFGATRGMEGGKTVTVANDGVEVEEWLELDNGCMCCSAQDAGVRSIERLMGKKGKFDAVIIELSGVADPSTVASLFWMDEGIGSDLILDGVVCIVDCLNFEKQLEEAVHDLSDQVARQVACADVIVMSKVDISPESEPSCRAAIKTINSVAPINVATMGNIDLSNIFNLDAYGHGTKAFSSLHSIPTTLLNNKEKHINISTISIPLPPMDVCHQDARAMAAFDKTLRTLLWEGELPPMGVGRQQILRCKGVLHQTCHDNQLSSLRIPVSVVQGVRDIYTIVKVDMSDPPPPRLVIIGKHFNPNLVDRFLKYMHEQEELE